MKITQISEPGLQYRRALQELWNNEYPVSLVYKTAAQFDNYLAGLKDPQHFLLMDEQDIVRGWAFTFNRDLEKWFAIILGSELHGKGIGRQLIQQLQDRETVLNGWVIDRGNHLKTNGHPYRYPLGFYVKCGFDVLPEIRLDLPHFSAVKIQWQKK